MRRFTVATLVMAVALLTACDGDSTGNGGSIVGTYTLQTVNGETLPFVTFTFTGGSPGNISTEELTAASFRLNSDNKCSLTKTFRETFIDATGNVTVTTNRNTGHCTYSVTGTTIQSVFPGQILTGTISGNTLTIVGSIFGVLGGDTFVFTK